MLAEIVLAQRQIGEKEVMIHDDHVGIGRALVHGGDKAAIELRAFLAGAGLAARVEPRPQFGAVRQKIQFRAVACLRQPFPIANLREPVQLLEALEHRLPFHLMQFLPAQEIRAALHHRHFQLRREMLLQKGDVLGVQLLLQ